MQIFNADPDPAKFLMRIRIRIHKPNFHTKIPLFCRF